jgi:hypothetical protein
MIPGVSHRALPRARTAEHRRLAKLPSYCSHRGVVEKGQTLASLACAYESADRSSYGICIYKTLFAAPGLFLGLIFILPMNLKLKELSRTILKLDSGGSLESLYVNYSTCLRHLTEYLSQKEDSERKALLAVLRNMAFNKHQDLGRPVDEATIAREMRDAFRKLLLQVLEANSKEDIDALYEAIVKGEIR